jgi:hypothetical protein
MRNWTWDPILQWRLDYSNMVDFISQEGFGSVVDFNIGVHTYPWYPIIWLYTKR